MEFRSQAQRYPHHYRELQYRYESRDYSSLRPLYPNHVRDRSYGSGRDISDVLADTDPWIRVTPGGDRAYATAIPAPSDSYLNAPSKTMPSASESTVPTSSYFGGDPLESFLSAKRQILARSAVDVVELIYDREQLHREQIGQIELEECRVGTGLLEIEGWPVGNDPNIDRRRESLEGHLLSLGRERRAQEVATWRDTARLRSDLRTILGELESEARKWTFLKRAGPRYG